MGAPQEPGRPGRLRAREPGGAPGRTAQARGWRARRPRERRSSARTVPPSEGNEARREGRSGVGALRCTGEAGEPTPGDPVEGRGCRVREPEEGKMTGTPSPGTISTRLHRIAKLSDSEPLIRRAGCVNRARPDPWEPRVGNCPGQPDQAGTVQST